jgi:hypothetical protein
VLHYNAAVGRYAVCPIARMVLLENMCVGALCFLKVVSDECLNWSIVTRAHALRQVLLDDSDGQGEQPLLIKAANLRRCVAGLGARPSPVL